MAPRILRLAMAAVLGTVPAAWGATIGPLVVTSIEPGNSGIVRIDPDGSRTKLTEHPPYRYHDYGASYSPDGSRIVFVSNRTGYQDIFIMDAEGGNPVNLTQDPAGCFEPAWSPDGLHIAYTSFRDDPDHGEIYLLAVDGSSQVNLTRDPGYDASPAWHPDGSRLAFVRLVGATGQIYVMDAVGWNVQALTSEPDGAAGPSWSPDGESIAYYNPHVRDLWVMDADGSNARRLTFGQLADGPSWSLDGGFIAFRRERGEMTGEWEVVVMEADGGEPVVVTPPDANDMFPAWFPVLGAPSLVRPASWGQVKRLLQVPSR